MLVEETIELEGEKVEEEMPSFNHSYLCQQISQQLSQNKAIAPLPKLTLDIGDGITPDISVFPKEKVKPNFFRDITRFPKMPILAIEVISANQNIQDLIDKSKISIDSGVKAVWIIEPFTNVVFVTTKDGVKRFYNQEVESEGIKVDFRKIFSTN